MSEAELAARFAEALVRAAEDASAGNSALVSMAMEIVSTGEAARIDASVQRKTRTLLFMRAEALDESGGCVATASSVHKVRQ